MVLVKGAITTSKPMTSMFNHANLKRTLCLQMRPLKKIQVAADSQLKKNGETNKTGSKRKFSQRAFCCHLDV